MLLRFRKLFIIFTHILSVAIVIILLILDIFFGNNAHQRLYVQRRL